MKELLKIPFDHKKLWHNFVLFAVVILCTVVCLTASDGIEPPINYSEADIESSDFWVQQFDAFEKGQLHIDVEPSDELNELLNPYDPEERDDIEFLWDRAYFEGHYYSYFGIAPILTVFYPHYFLTGSIPSVSAACLYMAVIAMLFLGFFYRELVIKFAKGANLWLTCVLFFGVAFSSGIFVALSWSDPYYVAVMSAIEWSMIFLFLGFRAMRAESMLARSILLALSAIALTMTIWSRPTVALVCLVAVPLFIEYLLRHENLKSKLISASAFFVPLACGAVAVMWYNAARFGSPFDFGSSYQLTVCDIRENQLDVSKFFDSIYHFFFKAPSSTRNFPFFAVSNVKPEYEGYFYCAKGVGALAFGIPLASLSAPFICRVKKDKYKFATMMTGLAICIFIAFFDYCYAGFDMRYVLDILPILTLLGAIMLLCAHKEAHGASSVRWEGLIKAIIIVLCVIAVLVTVGVTRMNPASAIFPIKE
ncbi:MAG: hypothetical protein E7640_04960 [Ruminococcaceae bacterium]|nr:hypothetical protein [Oscillospiraceae bacterium]